MKIVDSDAFLDMPVSAQALYFHLNMRADDDGFVNNPKRIQRAVGASEDDIRLLIMKRFVLNFESGVVVIKHWRMHNTLRRDRYIPTQYNEELEELTVKANGSYTDRLPFSGNHPATNRQPSGNHPATNRQPSGNQNGDSGTGWLPNGCQTVANPAPQYSIDKDSIVENSIDKDKECVRDNSNIYTKQPYGSGKNVMLTRAECQSLVDEYGRDMTIQAIEILSLYMQDKPGYRSESHYAAIRRWGIQAAKERKAKSCGKFNFEQRNTDYDAILSSGSEGGQA